MVSTTFSNASCLRSRSSFVALQRRPRAHPPLGQELRGEAFNSADPTAASDGWSERREAFTLRSGDLAFPWCEKENTEVFGERRKHACESVLY